MTSRGFMTWQWKEHVISTSKTGWPSVIHSIQPVSQFIFNTVSGVPRIKELISVSKKSEYLQIIIYLRPKYSKDEDRAKVILHKVQQTYLKDITKRSEIVYDPSDKKTVTTRFVLKAYYEVLRRYYNFMRLNSANCKFDTAWVLRIETDRYKTKSSLNRIFETASAALHAPFGCVYLVLNFIT